MRTGTRYACGMDTKTKTPLGPLGAGLLTGALMLGGAAVAQAAYALHQEIRVLAEQELPAAAPPEEVVERASPAVVQIIAYEDMPARATYLERRGGGWQVRGTEQTIDSVAVSSGSGFFVREDGYIITNNHVVDEDTEYAAYTGEERLQARVVYRDPAYDLAVLKVAGSGYPALALGDSRALEVGGPVVAMGNALGEFIDSASIGVVLSVDEDIAVQSGVERVGRSLVRTYDRLFGLIETTAKVYPGDSGGPLLNARGEVVGVNVATAVGERVGFAIPAELAKRALERALAQ